LSGFLAFAIALAVSMAAVLLVVYIAMTGGPLGI